MNDDESQFPAGAMAAAIRSCYDAAGGTMTIADLTAEHVPAMADILYEAFRVPYPDAWPTRELAVAQAREAFEAGRLLLGAFEGERLLGWCGAIAQYGDAQPSGWELHPLAVRPEAQRQGTGRRLVRELEARLAAGGASVVYLGTDDADGALLAGCRVDSPRGAHEHLERLLAEGAVARPDARAARTHPAFFYHALGYEVWGIIPDANGPGRADIVMAKRLRTDEAAMRDLQTELERYRGRFPLEADAADRLLALLAEGRAAFMRDRLAGHFTASAIVLTPDGSRTLLTHHRKLGMWLQLGGHADGETDLAAAALREACEESGLAGVRLADRAIVDIDVHTIPRFGDVPRHEHFDVRYLCIASADEPLVVSEESHDLAWVEIGSLSDYTAEESLARAVRKAIGRL